MLLKCGKDWLHTWAVAIWKVTKGKNQCLICSVGIFKAFDFKL